MSQKTRLQQEEEKLEELLKEHKGEDEEEQTEDEEEQTEDEETQEEPRGVQEETLKEEAKPGDPEEENWKKRYSDLRTAYNDKVTRIKELEQEVSGEVPASKEDIEAWKSKFPDAYKIVMTVAEEKAKDLLDKSGLNPEDVKRERAERKERDVLEKVRSKHKDFDTLQNSDNFHKWANSQPKAIQDMLFEPAGKNDPEGIIRVLDLYKADQNLTPTGRKKKTKETVEAVEVKGRTSIDSESDSAEFKESDVQKMDWRTYEANEEAILKAQKTGKFVYDVSGGVR